MSDGERGTALAETALVVGLALLVALNGFNLALLGFNQLHADAAAFVAARVQALSGSASTATSTTAAAVPPSVSLSLSSPGQQSQAIATGTSPGLVMVPGFGGSIPVRGAQLEATAPTTTSPLFAFSAPNTSIVNAYATSLIDSSGAPSTRAVYLAQTIDAATTSDVFHEWREHQRCYASISFPAQYSQTQSGSSGGSYTVASNNPWVSFPSGSAEATVHNWDGGTRNTTC